MKMRTCKKCSKTKPLTTEFFYEHPCGFRHECVECFKMRSKRWGKSNLQKRRVISKTWREANPDSRKEYATVYRGVNREKLSVYHKAYYIANVDKISAYHASRYKSNPEKAKVVNKRWREANPERLKAYNQNRRARKMSAEGHFTGQDIDHIWKRQCGRCSCCHAVLDYYAKRGYSIEHKIPLSRGGSNWPSNLELMCMPCNSSKKTKTPSEFRKWLRMISKAKDDRVTSVLLLGEG